MRETKPFCDPIAGWLRLEARAARQDKSEAGLAVETSPLARHALARLNEAGHKAGWLAG